MVRTGQEYLDKFARSKIRRMTGTLDLSPEVYEKVDARAAEMYDKECGLHSSSYYTFEIVIVVAFKP